MSTDRIAALERMVSELMRNTAGIPVRWASGGSGGGGTSTTDVQIYRVILPVGKATSNLETDWNIAGTGHLIDPSTGIENTDTEITLTNRGYWAYPAGTLIFDFGNGILIGPCGPPAFGWWDGDV